MILGLLLAMSQEVLKVQSEINFNLTWINTLN